MKDTLFKDIEKLAARIIKDPAAKKALEAQFRQLMASDSLGNKDSGKSPNEVLDEIYEKLKEQLNHVNSPSDLGDTDEQSQD